MGISTLFMKIVVEGNAIEGESTSLGYEGQIELESFNWELESNISKREDSSTTFTTTLEQKHLRLTKVFDKATGALCKIAAADPPRKEFSTAVLTMVTMSTEGGAKNNKVLELQLSDGHIEEVTLNASESGKSVGIRETVTLSYTKSELRFFPLSHVVTGARSRSAQMTFSYPLK